MTITYDITKAERHHKPVAELRRQQIADVTKQIEYETDLENAVSMHARDMIDSLRQLCKLSAENPKGYALTQRELPELEKSFNRLAFLISALKARKVDHG